MIKHMFIIQNALGMHTRTSAALVNCASRFISEIRFENKGEMVDAKRILSVMSSGLICGDRVWFSIDGPDEQEALQALIELFEETFVAIG